MSKERFSRFKEFYKCRQWKFAILGAVLLIAMLFTLHYSRMYIQQSAMGDAVQSLESVMNNADLHIHKIETAADSLLPLIEQHLDNPEIMFDFSKQLLEDNPDMKGCSISFEPYFFKQKGEYFSAYSYNHNGVIETEQEGDDGYQYFYMDWYLIPHQLDHKYWIEPFEDESIDGIQVNEVMTSYCQPIYNADGKSVGVLSADVPLKWLSDLVLAQCPMPRSYCMLIGRGGSYIVHPDSTKLLYQTIFTPTQERRDTALMALGRAMVDGETGYKELKLDGLKSHVFYMPFRQTGWSIAMVCPDVVILNNYLRLLCVFIPFILLTVILMIVPIWRWLRRYRNKLAVCLVAFAFILTSCQSEQQSSNSSINQNVKLSKHDRAINAIIDADSCDSEFYFQVLDSIEPLGALATSELDYYRAEKYFELDQFRSAVIYYKNAIAGDALLHISPSNYYNSFVGLHTCYSNINNLQEALAAATQGYQLASKDTTIIGRDMANNLLMQIGLSQLKLNHADEAAKTFDQVRKQTEELALIYPLNNALQESCLLIASNIINGYLNRYEFDIVEPWISMMEQSLERYAATDATTNNYGGYLARLLCNKAVIYAKTGRMEEADVAYQNYLALPYAQTFNGIYNQAYYLEVTEQWQKLLDIQLRIDSAEMAAGIPPTIDYLIESPATTFKALINTGRKEEALQRARQIINLLDSVKEYQHRSDAEELAVIYETQQKEAQIAQQKADINQQRMIGIGVGFLFLITFIGVLYELYRRLRKAHAELEVSYKKLMIANERAEESSKMKSNFIRQVSHEIRTPLNILSGFTQIITMPDMVLDESTRKDINQKIIENTGRITNLVNKMIELSDANSQTVIERTDQVLAIQLAAKAADVSGITELPHIKFDMQIQPETESLMITTDESAASRALAMILDNAGKFTRPANAADNKPTVKQKVTLSVGRTKNYLCLAVEDTGIGVPAEAAEIIFDEFVQLDEYYEGTGIGLTVARSFARRLGGDVVLDTAYTSGARFVMTLPL
jgi:signal transduction histidine kinase